MTKHTKAVLCMERINSILFLKTKLIQLLDTHTHLSSSCATSQTQHTAPTFRDP